MILILSLLTQDIQYGDIDYMLEYRDFTIDPVNFAGLPEYVQKLKTEGTRYVIILVSHTACHLHLNSNNSTCLPWCTPCSLIGSSHLEWWCTRRVPTI